MGVSTVRILHDADPGGWGGDRIDPHSNECDPFLLKATTISPPEFALWRSSGTAFNPRAGGEEVGIPNPTLQSGRHTQVVSFVGWGWGGPKRNPLFVTPLPPFRPPQDGQPGAERGFWGDVVTGPFLIFGLTRIGTHEKVVGALVFWVGGFNVCDGVVFYIVNSNPPQTATEISVAKVTELLWELHGRGSREEPPRDEGDEDGDADPPEEPLWDGSSALGEHPPPPLLTPLPRSSKCPLPVLRVAPPQF